MRALVALLLVFGLTVQAGAPVPRPAGEFSLREPTGKTTLVSSLKGKVVVIQFLFTGCSHCQDTAVMLSKVQADFASKGVAVYGVAFNDEVLTPDKIKNAMEVSTFASRYAKFPLAIAPRDAVMKYLGLSMIERWGVPQIVVIDKKGVIQAQSKSTPSGPEPLQHEPSLRNLLTMLVNQK